MKLLCGGIAGAFGQTGNALPIIPEMVLIELIVAYPLDVVRRQMQTMGFEEGHGHIHKTTLGALKTIYNKEGILGLFKGLQINYIKVVPAVAISFTTYESTKKFLGSL